MKNKKILITGGAGMIGHELVDILISKGNSITVTSIEAKNCVDFNFDLDYIQGDLRDVSFCRNICKGKDIIFHLAGIKGSPQMAIQKPSSFFVPMLQLNTNLLDAAARSDAEWVLYTSSVGVYGNFESPEDEMWKEFPSQKDWYGGWAKRMGELQIDSYIKEFGINRYSIVRPANVFGKRDNFDSNTGMVIPSLISRIESGESPLTVWGDGYAIRDFIFARDVAEIMAFVVENKITGAVNAGTGKGITIKKLVEKIKAATNLNPDIIWDCSKPSGDKSRVLNSKKLNSIGFNNFTNIDEALSQTVEWYKKNKNYKNNRYNSFK